MKRVVFGTDPLRDFSSNPVTLARFAAVTGPIFTWLTNVLLLVWKLRKTVA